MAHVTAYTFSTQRSIGTSWNVGGFLGINIGSLSSPAAFAGFSASFTQTTTTGDSSGVSTACGEYTGQNGNPGNWTCGMDVRKAYITPIDVEYALTSFTAIRFSRSAGVSFVQIFEIDERMWANV